MTTRLLTPTSPKLADARSRLLKINEPAVERLDELVLKARAATRAKFLSTEKNGDDTASPSAAKRVSGPELSFLADFAGGLSGNANSTTTGKLLRQINEKGIGAQILKLTTSLNRLKMDDVSRLLLATEGVYEKILLNAFKKADVKAVVADTEGLVQQVMVEAAAGPRAFFVEQLVREFALARNLDLESDDNKALRARFLRAVVTASLPVTAGRTSATLQRLFDAVKKQGDLRQFVDEYAERADEIEPARFSETVRAAMVRYLETLGLLSIDQKKFDAGEYDEYFAQAYDRAIFAAGTGGEPPIVEPAETDFLLDTFEQAEEQGVIKDNLLAASALYYFNMLGDTLGIFPLVNALILRRARGRLDLPRGAAAQKLTEYKRFVRNAPVATEDRLLLYKRVFNAGDGETLEDTIVNEDFPTLYRTLMEKVVEYIRKEESNSSERDDKISRAPIDEAVRNLQFNLSYFGNDIAEDTLVIKDQFNLAKAILTDDDVIAAVGVTRRGNMWSLIERLAAEELNKSASVATLRTLGIEGYRILQYVANFEPTTTEDQFRQFLRSAEAWIIAQASLGEEPGAEKDDDWDDSKDDEEEAEPALKGEADDWDN